MVGLWWLHGVFMTEHGMAMVLRLPQGLLGNQTLRLQY